MSKIIKPKEFLIQLKNNNISATTISPSDLLEITELNITIPFASVFNISEFHNILKKAVSEFNWGAALNDHQPIDFDDLYTKYTEYIEALKS